MDQKASQKSIIHLFEKMNSNVTRFYSSNKSITKCPESSCSCKLQADQRAIEFEFYENQWNLVGSTLQLLTQNENQCMSQQRFLGFMKEFLAKILTLLQVEQMCLCKKQKIAENQVMAHKVHFLREENHKFFKLYEEKNVQCDSLREKFNILETRVKSDLEGQTSRTERNQKQKSLLLSEQISKNIESIRLINNDSSSSSRISEFKHCCPDYVLPLGGISHKKYFNESKDQNQEGKVHFQSIGGKHKESDLNFSTRLPLMENRLYQQKYFINESQQKVSAFEQENLNKKKIFERV